MRQKAEYRSSIRSRRMIREAYAELSKEKDIAKITVTDIVRRADLNRATFYAHYPDVRGVTEEVENEVIEKMFDILKDFQYAHFFNDPMPLFLKANRFLEQDLEFYRTLICTNGSEQFLRKLKKVFSDYMLNHSDIPEELRHSQMIQLRVGYAAGGIVNLYQQWFQGELDCSLNDIAAEISTLLKLGAQDTISF